MLKATQSSVNLRRRIRLERMVYCVTRLTFTCFIILAATGLIEVLIFKHEYWYRNNLRRFRFNIAFADHGIFIKAERYKGSDAGFIEFCQNHANEEGWLESGWQRIVVNRRYILVHYSKTPSFGTYFSGKNLIISQCNLTNCSQSLNASIPMVYIALPLWFIQLPVGMILAILIYCRWRRFDPVACRRCGFNLRANQSGICPECGTPLTELNQTIIDASSQ